MNLPLPNRGKKRWRFEKPVNRTCSLKPDIGTMVKLGQFKTTKNLYFQKK